MTIKRRVPKDEDAIERFGNEADGTTPPLDPSAKRDFKSIRVPFNEYEYKQLVKGAELSGRSKLNFMRFAMLKLTDELKSEGLTYDDSV